MKRPLFLVVILLMLASLACSIDVNLPNVKVTAGPTQTFQINEPLPSGSEVQQVEINMGAGKLNLSGTSSALASGSVEYNIVAWKPAVERNGNQLKIKQETSGKITLPSEVVNNWDVQLSTVTPMDLKIAAGAYQGNMDLSGMRLASLSITDGASDSTVQFNVPNPEKMTDLTYKTGASQVKLYGLANANFSSMNFEGGAGNYVLDFTGKLQQDATLTVKTGVSAVTISVPKGMSVKVSSNSAISNVDTQGNWTSSGNTYDTQGEGPTLTVDVTGGLGALKLVQE
jgi:hypothetical protein